MPLRPCLDCGRLSTSTRCPEHTTAQGRLRKERPTNIGRDAAERERRAQAVAQHRARYGNTCPGFEIEPHQASDLTADHIHSVEQGGDPNGELQVLCRHCNGRKSNRQ